MKKSISILVILILTAAAFWYLQNEAIAPNGPNDGNNGNQNGEEIPDVEVVLDGLEIPWDIAWFPSGEILVAERPGRLLLVDKNKERKEITVDGVKHSGEGGLLGIKLHPNFSENKFIYLYISSGYNANQTRNRVERYRLENNALSDKKIIIENIPGAIYHDGGRMEFGPDGLLYITTGDATNDKIAQDKNSLGGKILRLQDDGSIPPENPFNSAIWSYGHRNPQGIAWDDAGRLWETEHGPSALIWPNCCQDEINLIEVGKNYGWPASVGDKVEAGTVAPVLHSGRNVWAPASLVYLKGSLFFGGLKGEALYEAVLDGENIKEFKTHFKNEFGRIRTVRVGPDKMLYLATSNRDGRGNPEEEDDRIIRINPSSLK